MAGRLRKARKGCGWLLLVLLGLVLVATVIAWVQARRTPDGEPVYVALGSSFAAGAGLGPLQEGAPWLCARSTGGYPSYVSRALGMPTVDMSCGGAVTRHLAEGGQFFQGPQIRVIDARTRLVTITVGGNDIGYAGDLSLYAARQSGTLFGWAARTFWSGPGPRDHDALRDRLAATLRAIRAQAPDARIVVATYPAILPPAGTCPRIGMTAAEADEMRGVADRLAATTRAAAEREGAIVVDMHRIGAAHHACSAEPWTNGWSDVEGAPFHPNAQGAEATAQEIVRALRQGPPT